MSLVNKTKSPFDAKIATNHTTTKFEQIAENTLTWALVTTKENFTLSV